jgi:hypothetical protein
MTKSEKFYPQTHKKRLNMYSNYQDMPEDLGKMFDLLKKKIVSQSRTGLQIYEEHDDQLNRPGPMA